MPLPLQQEPVILDGPTATEYTTAAIAALLTTMYARDEAHAVMSDAKRSN